MPIDKIAFGQRLKEYAIEKHGNVAKFGREVWNMKSPSAVYQYVDGRSLPGAELIAKLLDDGCNFNWLCTGRTQEQQLDALEMKVTSLTRKLHVHLVEVKEAWDINIYPVLDEIRQLRAPK